MRSFVAFRLTAQLCVASAVLCLFSPLNARWPVFALLLGLSLLAGLGAGGCKRAPVRLLWGLLPLAALLLSGSDWSVRAAVLAMTAYAVLFLTLGRFSVENWQYRGEVAVVFVLTLVVFAVSGLVSASSAPPRLFSLAGLGLSLLALRTLQMGAAPSARWQAGNVGLFFLPIAGGALVGTALWYSAPVLQLLARGLGAVLAGILSLWNTFWTWLLRLFSIGEDFFQETPPEIPLPDGEAELAQELAPAAQANVQLPEVKIPWLNLLVLLAAAAVILLAVRLLRRSMPAEKAEKREDVLIEEELPREPRARRSGRRHRKTDRSNREEIRSIYREYLAFLRSRQIRPELSATTADISAAAASVLSEPDERLREIYRRSRYSEAPVTREDVLSARELLDSLLKSKDEAAVQTS